MQTTTNVISSQTTILNIIRLSMERLHKVIN